MSVRLADHDKCTGCSACAAVCPTKSICMVQDVEGFYFPMIKENCIACNKCTLTCPVICKPILKSSIEQKACIAIYKDKEVWMKSTSGGAFTAICNSFGDDKTIVFGAVFDSERRSVKHDWVEGVENIGVFRGSKYAQSCLDDSLYTAKKFLDLGKKVIFSGTPCQISALRKYLCNDQYANLLCVDLICHGVGSPKVFERYLNSLSKQHESNVLDYGFRYKKIKFGIQSLYNSRITYQNGTVDVRKNDLYNNLFLQKIICRKSCDNCEYASTQRFGDLTIGDAKRMYTINTKLPVNRNGSVVISNTEMGHKIFDSISQFMDVYPCSINDVKKTNQPFSQCIHSPDMRKEFFENFDKVNDVNMYMKQWNRELTLWQKLKMCIPEKYKELIKKLIAGERM